MLQVDELSWDRWPAGRKESGECQQSLRERGRGGGEAKEATADRFEQQRRGGEYHIMAAAGSHPTWKVRMFVMPCLPDATKVWYGYNNNNSSAL